MSLPPENRPAGAPSPYETASATGAETPDAAISYGPPDTPALGATHQPGVQVPYPSSPSPFTPPSGLPQPVSLWPRSSAFILDLFLTFCAVLVLVLVGLGTGAEYFAGGLVSIYAIPWIAIVLNTVSLWLTGRTLGQRLSRIKVVDQVTGEPIGLARTLLRTAIIVSPLLLLYAVTFLPILRYLGYYSNGPSLSGMTVVIWIIMLIVAAASGRSLHDRAAGSTVIRA